MPAKGNKFRVDRNVSVVGKILSRKQKKRLEQIVDKKKKKEGRAELLEALSSVQTSSLEGYVSLSSVQTKGVKKQLVESKENLVLRQTEETRTVTAPGQEDTALGRKRKRRVLQQKTKVPRRPDVVGFDSDSSDIDSDDGESEEEEEEEEEQPSVASSPSETEIEENNEDVASEREEYVPKPRDDEDKMETIAATSHKPSDIKVIAMNLVNVLTSLIISRL